MGKLSDIFSGGNGKYYYLALFIGLLAISLTTAYLNIASGFIIAGIPLFCLTLLFFFKKPYWLIIILFIVNYIIMGISRYILDLPGGIIIDILLLVTITVLIGQVIFFPVNYWKNINNTLTYMTLIWFIYCIIEILNPYTTPELWLTSVRGIAFYMVLFILLTFALLHKYIDLKRILTLWAILTVLAVSKALIQKFIGFDWAENHWLFTEKGSKTHIIYSGIRYFSFFTDAANFGCSMALSMVVFSISALYVKNKYLKIFFIITTILSAYGMIISGTRAALAVPFIGYTIFIILSKQTKIIIGGAVLILSLFVFFNFTSIGQGNAEIRRMRTAFDGTKDASFVVRIENQKKMKEFMPSHPFGIGIGKSKHAEPQDYMYGMATDSSLVFIWVETGIVGLIIYLSIFLFVVARGIYDVLFRIKNKELRGIMSALVAGLTGMLVTGYGNEVLQQFPTGPILYMSMAFIMMGRYFDKEIENNGVKNSPIHAVRNRQID